MGGKLSALMWGCPYCRAPIGAWCVTVSGDRASMLHVHRYVQVEVVADAAS